MNSSSGSSKLDNATLTLFKNVHLSLAISVVYMVVTVVNLVGNSLSMWLLLFRTFPKTPSIIFMINLTFTDLFLGIALPFQISYQLQGYNWSLGPNMCSFLTLMFFTNMYCSILTMMAIGIDRYLGIVRPLLFRETSRRRSMAILSCFFMWGLVLSVLYPLMTTDLTFHIPELGITTCFDVLKKSMLPSQSAWAAFLFCMCFVLFFFPFCITTFCYIRVIKQLGRDSKTAQKGKAIRLAAIVLLVFTVCFAPNNLLLLAHTVMRLFYDKSLYTAYKLTLCFSCLNSCIDPFIYYFASRDFRQKMRQIMRWSSVSSTESKQEHREILYSMQCGSERATAKETQISDVMMQLEREKLDRK